MSWSVWGLGKATAVAEKVAEQFANHGKCTEPEESIRLASAKLIAESLAAQDPSTVVKVNAQGSQSFKDWNAKTGVSNGITIVIEPQHGFME